MKKTINFKLNGKPVTLDVDSERKLIWVLRVDLGLTGTKYGCGESYCGACTVIVNNKAVLFIFLRVRIKRIVRRIVEVRSSRQRGAHDRGAGRPGQAPSITGGLR